ncbi:hypothetical protein DFH07DRAFT_945308 [Mycena maculata]|uniref:Uncharacterized protein n=1 Tax=Mycena maculata TaxID=230809 RepID=A0AAD7MT67_9AGAR|nr:hypothetical protein DFH07DRAFT_945308 [Mycena maculata]
MFQQAQGSSVECRIVLSGDTVDQFHTLCWALYALPDEISKQESNQSSMDKLENVALISHRYHLTTYHTWSMSIGKRCTHFDYLSTCSLDNWTSLSSLFILSADSALIEHAQDAWITRLKGSGIDNLEEFSRALDLPKGTTCVNPWVECITPISRIAIPRVTDRMPPLQSSFRMHSAPSGCGVLSWDIGHYARIGDDW